MADNMGKVYTPTVIPDTPFPQEDSGDFSTEKNIEGVYTPKAIKDQPFPDKKVAHELLSAALNTRSKKILKEFQFTPSGAIQIGKYEQGQSGDIKISPAGIVARNLQGQTTFALDGETGDAIFKGEVQAGSLISGNITLGGKNNQSGIMNIADAEANIIIKGDRLGHHYYNTSGIELIKVDWEGFHAYDLLGNRLIFVDEVGFHGYNTSGVEKLRINESGLFAYGTGTNVINIRALTSDSTNYGNIGFFNSQNAFYIASSDNKNLYIFTGDPNTDATFGATRDVLIDAGGDIYLAADSAGGEVKLKGADTGALSSSGVYFYDYDAGGYVEKMAIVETKEGYKALYCIESPEVWFMDFCKNKNTIDPLFLEVTKPPYRFMPCEDEYGIKMYQVWGKRKGIADKRFEDKTEEEFIKNNLFWSTPKR